MTVYRFFSMKKCSSYNTSSITLLKQVKQHS